MIQKSLSTKPILIADYREEEIIELIKDVKVIKDNLPVGDFLIGEILIERKTFNDFIQSVFDGRIFSQLEEALKNFKKVIFLVEGEKIFLDEKEEKIYFSMLARLIAFNNVSIIFTQSIFESAKFLESLCHPHFSSARRATLLEFHLI